MWIKCISFIEHLVSAKMKEKRFEVPKNFINEDFSFGAFFPSINKTTIDFSFTLIILLQLENQAINEIYSYSGGPKSLQKNNKTHDKSV